MKVLQKVKEELPERYRARMLSSGEDTGVRIHYFDHGYKLSIKGLSPDYPRSLDIIVGEEIQLSDEMWDKLKSKEQEEFRVHELLSPAVILPIVEVKDAIRMGEVIEIRGIYDVTRLDLPSEVVNRFKKEGKERPLILKVRDSRLKEFTQPELPPSDTTVNLVFEYPELICGEKGGS